MIPLKRFFLGALCGALAIGAICYALRPRPSPFIVDPPPGTPNTVQQSTVVTVHGSVRPKTAPKIEVCPDTTDYPTIQEKVSQKQNEDMLPPGEYLVPVTGEATATYIHPKGVETDTQPVQGVAKVTWHDGELSVDVDLDLKFTWVQPVKRGELGLLASAGSDGAEIGAYLRLEQERTWQQIEVYPGGWRIEAGVTLFKW